MSKILANIRPSVIFDHNSSVLVDMGAMEHLDGIHVIIEEQEQLVGREKLPSKIVISPKRLLSVAPLLEPLDARIKYTVER